MPPPMPNPAKRMTANPARPVARYRPGKPVAAEEESSDDDEESEEEQPRQSRPQRVRPRPPLQRPQAAAQAIDDEDEEGFVTDPEDEGDPVPEPVHLSTSTRPGRPEVGRGAKDDEQSASDSASESESDEEDSSEEEESSESEQETRQRKFLRPTFMKKSDRQPPTAEASRHQSANGDHGQSDPEVDVQARRLAQADLFIKDKLERDALARAQGKKAWDDDDDVLPESMVDDTDGADPDAEYAAWKLRELKRLKRDRDALIAREKEIEEVERRRNLTAEERAKEDQAFLDQQREDKESSRSDPTYLARYHHKGAFFQGDEAADLLKRRNVMGARFEDEVADKAVLPEYMRLRDMTKLGKKGRTRYTDLKGQDTGRFGEDVKRWRGSGGDASRPGGDFDSRGLDERFQPDDQRRSGPTGANASAVGFRRDRNDGRERSWGGDKERRKRSYSRSRSRSRSPRRQKRDSSREPRHHDRGIPA